MDVSLVHIDDCPSWQVAEARLVEALRLVGREDQAIVRVLITTDEQAQALSFRGSPTILVDGEDPFAGDNLGPFGLTCRVYPSDAGLVGSPSVGQIAAAIGARV